MNTETLTTLMGQLLAAREQYRLVPDETTHAELLAAFSAAAKEWFFCTQQAIKNVGQVESSLESNASDGEIELFEEWKQAKMKQKATIELGKLFRLNQQEGDD